MEEKNKLNAVKDKVELFTEISSLIYKNIDDYNTASEILSMVQVYTKHNEGNYFTDEQIDIIKKSFQPLSPEDDKKWWLGHCQICGWWGSTELCGGGQIADTGDYDGPYCPICGSDEIADVDEENIDHSEELFQMLAEVCDDCGHWDNGLWRGKEADPQTIIKARNLLEKVQSK